MRNDKYNTLQLKIEKKKQTNIKKKKLIQLLIFNIKR